MKRCPSCDGIFDESFSFCPKDTTKLLDESSDYLLSPNLPRSKSRAQQSGNNIKIIGALIILAAIVVSSYFAFYHNKLEPYKGSLDNLFIDQVGDYKRAFTTQADLGSANKDFGSIDASRTVYRKFDDQVGLGVVVLNFASVDEAKKGLKKFEEKSLGIKTNGNLVYGEEVKGNIRVGDRIEFYENTSNGNKLVGIVWTNRSLLITAAASDPRNLLEFEKNFPY